MLKVENIRFSYSKKGPEILSGLSFEAGQGELVAVLGTNGAGKSTLIKCIDRILAPSEGKVLIDGENVYEMGRQQMARHIAYVPQQAEGGSMTVFDAVLLGRRPYIKWDATENDRSIAAALISRMGLEEKSLSSVSQLSGGEAQKVLLARALAQEPRLLLLDEPTSSLDPKNQHQALSLVRSTVKERRLCAVAVLHDLNLALRYCDRFLFIGNGKLCSFGGIDSVNSELLKQVYGIESEIINHKGHPVVIHASD